MGSVMTEPTPPTSFKTATLLITEQAIRTYAELTNDFNPLHLDSDFAAQTPMGRVIAHGTLSLCLLWQAVYRNFRAADIASLELDVRFIKPVFIGDSITAGITPNADTPGGWRVWVRNQDGQDCVAGEMRFC
ncbi:MaoC family dehydratase [Bordetella tumulicola]